MLGVFDPLIIVTWLSELVIVGLPVILIKSRQVLVRLVVRVCAQALPKPFNTYWLYIGVV